MGVLFGAERAGLENDDVALANAIVTVPVNPAFYSLNLGQCVLLMAYEYGRPDSDLPPEALVLAGTERASQIEVEKLAEHFEERAGGGGVLLSGDQGPQHEAEPAQLVEPDAADPRRRADVSRCPAADRTETRRLGARLGDRVNRCQVSTRQCSGNPGSNTVTVSSATSIFAG